MGLGLGLWTYCNDPRFLGKGICLLKPIEQRMGTLGHGLPGRCLAQL